MNYDYTNYEKLYTIKVEFSNISHSIELDNNKMLTLNTFNDLNLISFNYEENKEIKHNISSVDSLIFDDEKTVLSINKLTNNIISIKFSNKVLEIFNRDTIAETEEDYTRMSIRDSNIFFIKTPEGKMEDNSEEFTKILTINSNNEDIFGKKEDMKEYIFTKITN